MTYSIFDIFKVGIGPSSSHTMGPMIAARKFTTQLKKNELLTQTTRIRVSLFGSLALTGLGHGTDKAVLLGLADFTPSTIDPEQAESTYHTIKETNQILLAGNKQIAFNYDTDIIFHYNESLPQHPNGMRFYALDCHNIIILTKDYLSIGGGTVTEINEQVKVNHSIKSVPYPFQTAEDLLQICNKNQITIYELMMENEKSLSNADEINQKLDNLWQTMKNCIERGLITHGKLPVSNIARRTPDMYQTLNKNFSQDPFVIMDLVTLYAMAVNEENACGGKIVTAPTNGGAGVLPAVLMYYLKFIQNSNQQGIRNFLLTAGAIAILYKLNASISGAEVGCQGEVGVACSMSAAALAAVIGGTTQQIENAAEIAMEHHLGMTCDPVGGLVQVPCIERNGIAAIKAITACRMAINSNGKHHIPLDTVIHTMYQTGKDMQNKYRETSTGGLAFFANKL